MQPIARTEEPSAHPQYRLHAVDPMDQAVAPINPFATAVLIALATVWMIALFTLAVRVAAQLNLIG